MTKLKDIKVYQVLPIKIVLDLLGVFFILAICAYALYKKYPLDYLLAIEFIILFTVVLLMFFIIGISNHRKIVEKEYENDTISCLECIKNKMEDGFHYHGLLHLNDLLKIEEKLSLSSSPKDCKVMVYTSDLATENDAEKVVDDNIKKGVQYIVLYFSNTCDDEEYIRIKNLYGEENLINLSKRKKYKNSFDGRLAVTLGFDITIYRNVDNKIKGYFAVDFVPKCRPIRSCHNPNCDEQCNYGKETEAFYNEISYRCTKRLYEEGLKIQQKFNQTKKKKHE